MDLTTLSTSPHSFGCAIVSLVEERAKQIENRHHVLQPKPVTKILIPGEQIILLLTSGASSHQSVGSR